MIQFAGHVQSLLFDAIASNSTEPSIVRQFTEKMGVIRGAFDGCGVEIRSKFIHQRPYAFFVEPPTIEGKRREQIRQPRRVQQQGARSFTGIGVN